MREEAVEDAAPSELLLDGVVAEGTAPHEPDGPAAAAHGLGRVTALDALRGLFVALMVFVDECGDEHPEWIGHSAWHGLRLADIVMPGFLFVAGAALGVALARTAAARRTRFFRNLTWRCAKLYGLGVLLQGGNSFEGEVPFGYDLRRLRFCGVLNRIGLALWVCGAVEIATAWLIPRHAAAASIMAHAALQVVYLVVTFAAWVPSWTSAWGAAPGAAPHESVYLGGRRNTTFQVECDLRGSIDGPACSAAAMLDRALFGQSHLGVWFSSRMEACSSCAPRSCPRQGPAWCWAHMYDPEGALGTLGSLVSVRLGLLCGASLASIGEHSVGRGKAILDMQKGCAFGGASTGLAGIVVAATAFPINKQLYSTSYALVTGALAYALLGLALQVCDVWRWRWIAPLASLGRNALLVFLLHGPLEALIDVVYVSESLDDPFPRHDVLSATRDLVLQGSSIAFAVLKTAAFWSLAVVAERNGVLLRV